jgi:transcriptional regulator with XRE-family HTH domain
VSRARKQSSLTQAALAERLGVTRTTVTRLEKGESVSIETVLSALSECGYAVAVVPKFSRVRIEPSNHG